MRKIEDIHKMHPTLKVLVTSDSHSFLMKAATIDYVYIIPGNIVHMDFSDETDIVCIGKRRAIYDFIEEMLSAELPLMLIKFIESD